ncbi:phage protein NinX family protein [Enterobacter cloacae complex sp. IR5457]|uniref:phage protein NinX family protein n=1 Tax=Enterobacter cloacae complex sp. IR5457 TaxID=3412374 RepID=UPI003BA01F0B
MDCSQLSDFEINQRVSNAIPGRFIFYPDYVWDSEWEKTFDPCNKAADAWPIITDNKISIYAMSEADARGKWGAEAFYPKGAYHFNDNPLRAAMIVFLMMQENQNG